MTTRPGTALDAVLVGLIAVSAAMWAIRWPTNLQDELSLLIYPDLMRHGQVPNRDFFAPYGPGTFWPLTAAYSLAGGPSVLTARVVGLGYHAGLALGVWALTRRRGRWTAVSAGGLTGLLSAGLMLVPYGWLLALALTLWSMVAADRGRWMTAGLLGAMAVTVRPEFVVIIVAVTTARLRTRRDLLRTSTGFVLGAIPLCGHLIVAGPELFDNVFVGRLLANTRLPLPPADQNVTLALVVVVAACLACALSWLRRPDRPGLAIALLSLGLLPQALQRADHEHILFVGCVTIPLALSLLGDLARRRGILADLTPPTRTRLAVGSAAVLVALGFAAPFAVPRAGVARVGDRSVYVTDDQQARGLEHVVAEVQASVGRDGRVFVSTEDMSRFAPTGTYLYYLLPDHVPDAYFLELAPGVSERAGSGLLEDVERADVLVTSPFSPTKLRELAPHLSRGSQEVNRYVKRSFCRAAVVEHFTIRRRC